MAFAMTLYNLLEGFAVACVLYMMIGLMMVFVIGMYNVLEGIIIVVLVYVVIGS